MKINKKDVNTFLDHFDRLVKELSKDLIVYREAAKLILSETDLTEAEVSLLNMSDAKAVGELAKMFFMHRIETFDGRKAGDSAVEEVEKIVKNAFRK